MPYVRSEFGHTHTGQCWEPMLSWLGRLSLNGPCQVRPAGFVTPPLRPRGWVSLSRWAWVGELRGYC